MAGEGTEDALTEVTAAGAGTAGRAGMAGTVVVAAMGGGSFLSTALLPLIVQMSTMKSHSILGKLAASLAITGAAARGVVLARPGVAGMGDQAGVRWPLV